MRRLGIVTGLKAEARIMRAAVARLGAGKSVIVKCNGPGLAAAGQAADAALAEGAEMLVSFGLAGGLRSDLPPGSLILPRRIISAEGPPLTVDDGSADAIAFAVASAVRISRENLVSVGIVVGGLDQKAALADVANAAAVDMESYGVARAAMAAQKPFLVLRAIGDPADRPLPPAAQSGMGPGGQIRPFQVMKALAREPRSFKSVIQLARDTRQAMRALRRAARLALPVLLLGG